MESIGNPALWVAFSAIVMAMLADMADRFSLRKEKRARQAG